MYAAKHSHNISFPVSTQSRRQGTPLSLGRRLAVCEMPAAAPVPHIAFRKNVFDQIARLPPIQTESLAAAKLPAELKVTMMDLHNQREPLNSVEEDKRLLECTEERLTLEHEFAMEEVAKEKQGKDAQITYLQAMVAQEEQALEDALEGIRVARH